MEQTSQELFFFEKYLLRSNKILALTGMSLKKEDSNKTAIQRIIHRPFYCISALILMLSIVSEIVWIIEAFMTGKTMTQITFTLPCTTFCMLGALKSLYFIICGNCVNGVVDELKKIQNLASEIRNYRDEVEESMLKNELWYYIKFTFLQICVSMITIASFTIGPLITMAVFYFYNNKIIYVISYPMWFPMDQDKFINWIYIYLYQFWAATIAVVVLLGPDMFFTTSTFFINIQFQCLQYDLERIDIEPKESNKRNTNENFRIQFVNMVKRHRILISCANLLELIFTKPTLFNVATSSIIICITGFNITAIDDKVTALMFLPFFTMSLLQIFVLCYYGDKLMENMRDDAAVLINLQNDKYNSRWYTAEAAVMKDLQFLALRSQKPCKITAYGFTDINLNTFCRIIGRSWSYFALLQSLYSEKELKE